MNKYMNLIGIRAKHACEYKVNNTTKNKVLHFYAKLLDQEKRFILNQNLTSTG